MKNNLLLVLLAILPILAFGQNKPLNKFYRENKREEGVRNAKLPGWVIRLGGKIARKKAENETEKEMIGLMRHFGKVKFMFSEEGTTIPAEKVTKLRNDLLQFDFDDLLMVRSEGVNLQIMIRDEGDIIQDVFMIVNDTEAGEMFFLSARTNLNLRELSKLLEKEMPDKLEPLIEVPEEEPPADLAL
ncbi:MAG: DUF4252 domain-containing protein [Saprospiraceae bacterium]|nr:DUF4252 domain-containing protein [Saprospiraceae bacterium]